jgi:hypothetical protein
MTKEEDRLEKKRLKKERRKERRERKAQKERDIASDNGDKQPTEPENSKKKRKRESFEEKNVESKKKEEKVETPKKKFKNKKKSEENNETNVKRNNNNNNNNDDDSDVQPGSLGKNVNEVSNCTIAFREQHSISLEGDEEFEVINNFETAKKFISPSLIESFCSKFSSPTPIQAQCWPVAVSGRLVKFFWTRVNSVQLISKKT